MQEKDREYFEDVHMYVTILLRTVFYVKIPQLRRDSSRGLARAYTHMYTSIATSDIG